MIDIKTYIQKILDSGDIKIATNRIALFEAFAKEEQNRNAVNQILEYQKMLTDKWKLKNRVVDICQQSVIVPNGTVGKVYETSLDFQKLGWLDFSFFELEGLYEIGLIFENNTKTITGTPTQSGDIKLKIKFRLQGETESSELNEKTISLVINPDPKSLWKNIPSDKEDQYWKEDNIAVSDKLGDKHIVISSKRGRSHANVGSFRDDDFGYRYFENTGWSVVVVADGAGSAKISRKGSQIACTAIVDYFTENLARASFNDIDSLMEEHKNGTGEETQRKLNHAVYNNLGKAALQAHKQLEEFAKNASIPIKDLHSTLIFCLIKKYSFGYAILTFGVGDCPIALLSKDLSEVNLMNWLDVGEFGGGTRFITMPEIFNSDKFATRFGFKFIDDFSYLMLMTDGIYDPKFVVEANLEKIDKWKEFVADLQGNNTDNVKVEFEDNNLGIADQLSVWMDFWSAGNHDDRTLAIVF